MEDDNVPHDVRLFVAHDSPLQGANFPISMQYFARHMYDLYTDSPIYPVVEAIPTILNFAELMSLGLVNVDFPSLSDVLTLNDTPAAMQMMYYWVDMSSDPTDDVHAIWQQEFETLGYPQNCRNIAISNGNECASEYPLLPRDKFISLHDTHNPGFFGDLLHLAVSPLIGVALDDIELAILGTIPGSSEYFFDFDLHANPESVGNPRKVYGGKLRYEKRLLWLVPVTHTITDRNEIATVGFLPFDVYSGGGITLSETIPSSILGSLPSNTIVNDTYDFIPVVSSLDIKRSNGNVNQSDYKKRYAGGLTPETALTTAFDNFIVDYNSNGENAPHISFQPRNGNWLAAEMQVNLSNPVYPFYDCSKFCSENAITGSAFLCGTQTYSVTNEATSTYWTVTQGSSLVNVSISAHQITLTPVSTNTKGWVTIEVTFRNSSCSGQSEMDIWVGKPEITNHTLNGFTSVVKNSSTGYSVNNPGQGITGYEWTITPTGSSCGCTTTPQGLITCPPNTSLPKFTNGLTVISTSSPYAIVVFGNCPGTYNLQCRAYNPCGSTSVTSSEISVHDSTNDCNREILISPNPISNNQLNIEFRYPPNCNGDYPVLENHVQFFDLYGNKRFDQIFDQDSFTINGLNLTRGHYIINIMDAKGNSASEIFIVE